MECACCGCTFQKKSGGYKRRGLHTKFKGGSSAAESLKKSYPISFTPGRTDFICDDCSVTIRSVDVKKGQYQDVVEKFRKVRKPGSYISKKIPEIASPSPQALKKRRKIVSTPTKRTPVKPPSRKLSSDKITVNVNNTDIGRAIQLLANYRYQNGIKLLLQSSKSARKAAIKVLTDTVRQESTKLPKKMQKEKNVLGMVQNFDWNSVINEARTTCPTLLEFLTASVTKKQSHKQMTKTKKHKTVSLLPIIGSMLCIIGHTRSSQCSILQQLVSIMLWLGGCKRKVFKSLNKLGWCISIDSTKNRIDSIRQNYDEQVKKWMENISNQDIMNETLEYLPELEDIWEEVEDIESEHGEESNGDQEEEDIEPEEEDQEEDQATESTKTTTEETSQMLPDSAGDMQCSGGSSDIPVPLPTDKRLYFDVTFDNVNQKIGVRHHVRGKKNTMLNMVQSYATLERIGTQGLSNQLPSADDIRNITVSDLLPSQEDENLLKSELSSLVSRTLCTYMDAFANLDVEWSIPHQYSIESRQKSEIVPLGILNKDESTTAGMIEILEDYTKYVPTDSNGMPTSLVLYCDGLSCERIDGAQRARINGHDNWARLQMFEPAIQEWHRRLMFVQDTYDELFKFDSHREKGTLYNMKQVYDHKGVTKNIMECFNKAEELLDFATDCYIVLFALNFLHLENVNEYPENFPVSSNERRSVLNDLAAKIVDSVYYSPNTKEVINVAIDKNVDQGQYCICQLDIGGTMIYCGHVDCSKGSWFHLECLGLDEDEVPEGEWFCSDECRKGAQNRSKRKKRTVDKFKDQKLEYVKHLLWRGLNCRARHDAVKENDGPRMIRHWKFDMFDFHEHNHPKYFIYGVRLLANVAGATSERVKHNLTWERTVNVAGGKRRNMPKDLHCEHLNREYKENSRDAGGQLTENTVNRHSQMLGIGRKITNIFEEQVAFTSTHTRKHTSVDRRKDVSHFIKSVKPQDLLQNKIGRAFVGFEEFKVSKVSRFPKKFKERLLKHVENMAIIREIQDDL